LKREIKAGTKSRNMNQIVITSDGSHTIFVPGLNEHYHSVNGAVQESEYIFLQNGYDLCNSDPLRILEIGFGTGLNALLTAVRSLSLTKNVHYTSLEKYPLDTEIIQKLNHYTFAGTHGKELFEKIHSCEWGKKNSLLPCFSLLKIKGDLITDGIQGEYDLVYFDAFGPDKQPEMWTRNIMEKVSGATKPGGMFVTYSSKGEIRRMLTESGFYVTLVPGPPGKRHIIRAIKN
jgi:tRNA U34 5-methylaminomethyl-2-thiouridine-forming methyltransferase MnmC